MHSSVTAWRTKWDSTLKENDRMREAADAAELKSVEKEEWTIKQRVVKDAVDKALKKWAKDLAARVEKARNKRISQDKIDRAAAIQHAIDVAMKNWEA